MRGSRRKEGCYVRTVAPLFQYSSFYKVRRIAPNKLVHFPPSAAWLYSSCLAACCIKLLTFSGEFMCCKGHPCRSRVREKLNHEDQAMAKNASLDECEDALERKMS